MQCRFNDLAPSNCHGAYGRVIVSSLLAHDRVSPFCHLRCTGDRAICCTCAIVSGLTDADAIAFSLSDAQRSGLISLDWAAFNVVLGALSNTFMKLW